MTYIPLPVATHDSTVVENGIQEMLSARATQAAAVAEGDNVRAVGNLYGEIVLAAFQWASQNLAVEETNPLDTRDIADTLADATSVAIGVTTVSFYLSMAHYRTLSIQWIPTSAQLELEVFVSNQAGVAPASSTYTNVTSAWFGASSYTTEQYLECDTPTTAEWVRIDVTNNDAGSAHAHDLFVKRAY